MPRWYKRFYCLLNGHQLEIVTGIKHGLFWWYKEFHCEYCGETWEADHRPIPVNQQTKERRDVEHCVS